MTATRRPMGPCPLPECRGAEHVHTGRSAPYRIGEAHIDIRYDGRSPSAAVEVVYVPRRGPERVVGSWADPEKAAAWFELAAREIRAAYVETVPALAPPWQLAAVEAIREVMYPAGDPDAEWSSDTIEDVAAELNRHDPSLRKGAAA